MAQLYFEKTHQNILIPADPGTSDFLRLVRVGQLLSGDFTRPRNYTFHKRFFSLLNLGYHYWTPVGGLVDDSERRLISGFIEFLSRQSTQDHSAALNNAADIYLSNVGIVRARDITLVKQFEPFRKWVTIQAGYYDEYIMPDGSTQKEARSISFAKMDDAEFSGVYKSVLNVLWNYVLRLKFRSHLDAENAAAQLMSYAG